MAPRPIYPESGPFKAFWKWRKPEVYRNETNTAGTGAEGVNV